MALTKLTAGVTNIQALADRPIENATQIKVLFDKTGSDIKTFINDTLTVEADATFATKTEVADIYAGGVADGSVADVKLSNTAGQIKGVVNAHLADDASLIVKGHVQLTSSLTSTSESLAPTANAVRLVYDKALAGQTVTGVWTDTFTDVIGATVTKRIPLGIPAKSGSIHMSGYGKGGMLATFNTDSNNTVKVGNSLNTGNTYCLFASGVGDVGTSLWGTSTIFLRQIYIDTTTDELVLSFYFQAAGTVTITKAIWEVHGQ